MPGQKNDITQAPQLLAAYRDSIVIADKGYGGNPLIKQLAAQGCQAFISPRSNRKTPREYDTHLYKESHLVECFFNKIKDFKRIFLRFDKKASSFMGSLPRLLLCYG